MKSFVTASIADDGFTELSPASGFRGSSGLQRREGYCNDHYVVVRARRQPTTTTKVSHSSAHRCERVQS